MTRARNAAKGLVTPPPLHRLMEAVLLLCVSLVQGAVSTFQMIRARFHRDWHTTEANNDLPQTTSSIPESGTTSGPPGSRPAVDVQRRNATLHDHALTFILRDDRSAIPQDEAGGCQQDNTEALMVSSARSARPPNHEGGLTAISPLMPTNVGIQGDLRTLSHLAASIPRALRKPPPISV